MRPRRCPNLLPLLCLVQHNFRVRLKLSANTNLDAKFTPFEVLSVEAVDGIVGVALIHEPHKGEAARFSGAKVPRHVHITKLAIPGDAGARQLRANADSKAANIWGSLPRKENTVLMILHVHAKLRASGQRGDSCGKQRQIRYMSREI